MKNEKGLLTTAMLLLHSFLITNHTKVLKNGTTTTFDFFCLTVAAVFLWLLQVKQDVQKVN